MLHLVVRHVQPLRDRAVGGVLVGARRGPGAPESEQQHRLAQLRLMLLGQLREARTLLHHLTKFIMHYYLIITAINSDNLQCITI